MLKTEKCYKPTKEDLVIVPPSWFELTRQPDYDQCHYYALAALIHACAESGPQVENLLGKEGPKRAARYIEATVAMLMGRNQGQPRLSTEQSERLARNFLPQKARYEKGVAYISRDGEKTGDTVIREIKEGRIFILGKGLGQQRQATDHATVAIGLTQLNDIILWDPLIGIDVIPRNNDLYVMDSAIVSVETKAEAAVSTGRIQFQPS